MRPSPRSRIDMDFMFVGVVHLLELQSGDNGTKQRRAAAVDRLKLGERVTKIRGQGQPIGREGCVGLRQVALADARHCVCLAL